MGKNLKIAKDRAWNLTLTSRGKEPTFWGPYAEEWQKPPSVGVESQAKWEKWVQSSIGRLLIRKGRYLKSAHILWALTTPCVLIMFDLLVILLPLDLYPLVGLVVSAGIKAIGTAKICHKPYFESKKMTPHEVAVFVAERKKEYLGK